MLPACSNNPISSSSYSSDLHNLKKPKTPEHHLPMKNATTFNFLHTHISADPRFWLLAAFLSVQALILFITRSAPLSLSPKPPATNQPHFIQHRFPTESDVRNQRSNRPSIPDDPECQSGRVYIYDIPSMFTKDLVLSECNDLHPWRWQCGIGPNDGYGKDAVELAGILPDNFVPAWYRTNQFSLELIFHYRMLNYRCRTREPESATAFYMPFYAGLAVAKYLWINDTAKRDWHCNMFLKWVKNQTYWQKNKGSDHFITLGRITWDFRRLSDPGREWGSSFLNLPEMERVMRFNLEKAPGIDLDISVPYPTGFHPHSKKQILQWQSFLRKQNRTSLFTFIGASHGSLDDDFRSLLLNYCYNESTACQVVDCALTPCNNGSSMVLKASLSSHFCLQPKGDSYTRRGVFDCMVAGSIPVFFWKRTAYDQYQWFLPGKPKSYSVYIDHEDVRKGKSIRKVLEGYSKEEVRKMREKVIETVPSLVYARPKDPSESIGDAFEIAVEGVLGKLRYEKIWNEEWKDDEDDENVLTR